MEKTCYIYDLIICTFHFIYQQNYYDAHGLNDPVGFPNQEDPPSLPSPFNVTKTFIKDEVASSSDPELTPLMMQFGQFLDHDLTLSAEESGGAACLRRRYLQCRTRMNL
jgi:hypothetical protein